MKKYIVKNNLIESSVEEFITSLEKNGTPLIEKIENDKDNYTVTFIYVADTLLDNVLFYGDFQPDITESNIDDFKMDNIPGTTIWHISFKIQKDIQFMYYFFPNDSLIPDCENRWDNPSYDIFSKHKMTYDGEGGEDDMIESYCIMPHAKIDSWLEEPLSIPLGKIQKFDFKSDNFKDSRDVYIYTPADYSFDEEPYGFIMLTDGCDYIETLKAPHILDNLIASKAIPPVVAVFVDSSDERYVEMTCNDTFCSTLVDELLPWVSSRYNISSEAQKNVISGLSLGGLSAAYMGLKHSDVFGNVLCKSGSFWYAPEDYQPEDSKCWMLSQFESIPKLPLKFYMNVGLLEDDSIINTTKELRDGLLNLGYPVTFDIFKSGHDYLCWGQTFAEGLISLIGLKTS